MKLAGRPEWKLVFPRSSDASYLSAVIKRNLNWSGMES